MARFKSSAGAIRPVADVERNLGESQRDHLEQILET